MTQPIPTFVADVLAQLELPQTPEKLALLSRYLELLLEANEKFNLTAIRDLDSAWRRHIIDSLTILPGLEDFSAGAKVIDVGSGGGLPGIPVAIARPDVHVVLLEATGKKARFLEQCVKELSLPNATVINERAEATGQNKNHREQYDIAMCRAIGPMSEVLEVTLPLLKLGGALLAMKGPKAEEELKVSGDAMAVLGAGELEVYAAYPESFGQNTVIVRIVNTLQAAMTPKPGSHK